MGLQDIATDETAVMKLTSFVQYYNTNSLLGITLSDTLKNLQLELGSQDCQLGYDFKVWYIS